jgi:hypothetical protein
MVATSQRTRRKWSLQEELPWKRATWGPERVNGTIDPSD